jgi:hypothetical protein
MPMIAARTVTDVPPVNCYLCIASGPGHPLPLTRDCYTPPALKLHHDPTSLRGQYTAADPFPHIVIDNLFDDEALQAVVREFPSPAATRWARFDNPQEKKLGFYYASSSISDTVRRFLDAMNGFEMLLFLEALTGIEGLMPDPYFGGGGLHQIEPGGFLKVHADFNVHPKLKIDRRLNMLRTGARSTADTWSCGTAT